MVTLAYLHDAKQPAIVAMDLGKVSDDGPTGGHVTAPDNASSGEHTGRFFAAKQTITNEPKPAGRARATQSRLYKALL